MADTPLARKRRRRALGGTEWDASDLSPSSSFATPLQSAARSRLRARNLARPEQTSPPLPEPSGSTTVPVTCDPVPVTCDPVPESSNGLRRRRRESGGPGRGRSNLAETSASVQPEQTSPPLPEPPGSTPVPATCDPLPESYTGLRRSKRASVGRKRGRSDLAGPSASATPAQSASRSRLRGRNAGRPRQTSSPVPGLSEPITEPYDDLGDCTQVCEFCRATFWFAERVLASPLSRRPRYKMCCRSGRVVLNYPIEPPLSLKTLYQNRLFMANIRRYNSMFAMTSFGAVVDDSVNDGYGPYVFKVSGQVSHRLGFLCPVVDKQPQFLQLYIYDTLNEVPNRLSVFSRGGRNPLLPDVVSVLIGILDEHNALVRLFRTARDICADLDPPDFCVRLYNSVGRHPYEAPSHGTLGAIVYDADPAARDFDIIVHGRDNIKQRVNNLHTSYMSLQYPLLFPYGEPGWSTSLQLTRPEADDDRRLTMNMFYSYQIHDRADRYTLLLEAGRLFQQYLVDAYICIERNRLDYILSNQNSLRTDFLSGVYDAISRGDTEGRSIGKHILLPSSFTGGPRYMYKHYQDALAICRVYGNPQYFITFTCNAKWPEIQRQLSRNPNIGPQDRADIVARVFKMKLRAFLAFLKEAKPFGTVVADLYTIEFQKRGLPHCHTLIWVADRFKIRNADEIDAFISAEVPDQMAEPVLYSVISETMMHGPCGLARMDSPCMVGGSCSKNFPKAYESESRFDSNGYLHYRRRPGGPAVDKAGVLLDNRFVVPYNAALCKRFRAHINVEFCGWSMLIKYLFKYISKGADRIKYSVSSRPVQADSSSSQQPASSSSQAEASSSSQSEIQVDEIRNFVDGRFICPQEAAWRILNFKIHQRTPAVQSLAVHLEGRQNITFRDRSRLEGLVRNRSVGRTTLTEWLRNNRIDPAGRHLRYIDYLSEFRWDASGKAWIPRLSNKTPSIGRLVYIHPSSGELFFLRILLNHQVGCRSFNEIKTVSGTVHSSYRGACEALGLIGDDKEWTDAFVEASTWGTASQLRYLFTHMLLYCEVSNPLRLWNTHWKSMTDDIALRIANDTNVQPSDIPPFDLQQSALYELEKLLKSNASSSSLSEYGLPMPQGDYIEMLQNRLLMEERCYDTEALKVESERLRTTLRPTQMEVYQSVIHAMTVKSQILLFIYGHGGTIKTYLWAANISAIRASSGIVLAVAASGIASLLLPSGRTAHSRFKIPVRIKEESLCNVTKGSQLAELLIQTALIIWDEAPMSDRKCFEALDRSVRDILDMPNTPFGGKSILLGGDFRQTLPVKKGAGKSEVISLSLPRSHLWPCFKIVRLVENLRLQRSGMSATERHEAERFSEWLLAVGNGEIGEVGQLSNADSKQIEVPTEFLIPYTDSALMQLIEFIYDSQTLNFPTYKNLSDKAIVCPKNVTADEINRTVMEMAPGSAETYLSTDTVIPHANERGDNEMLYPLEYLNGLNFQGIPAHVLDLKINTPVMLIRNINQTCGLCNGTRLLITQLMTRVIEDEIITGTSIGRRVYIPRIAFIHDNQELPFTFKRRQFPLRVCYAMTINKSQGQSLNKIGVYLPQDVFGHGQLYVALSRATSPASLKVLIAPQEGAAPNTTKNIVFLEFLYEINSAEVPANLSSLTPVADAVPVEVRVLNKWRPYHQRPTLSYLFVDVQGNAIQALFDDREEIHLDRKLSLMNCYRIEGYKCIRAPSLFRVTAHAAALQIDRALAVDLITDDDKIPRFYFDFKTHDQLANRENKNEFLTDYLGKVQHVTEVDTETRGRLTKIMLQDPSHPNIEVTLWEEIGSRVDLQALTATEHTVIAAITGLKVTRHPGTRALQLQSTAATCVKINPQTELAKFMASAFETALVAHDPTNTQSTKLLFVEKPSERKRRTLSTIRNEEQRLRADAIYTCEAKLVSIDDTQAWYYPACPKCSKRIVEDDDGYTCTKCQQKDIKYMYRITGEIADPTGTATITMFGGAVASMVGISCYDMIHEHGHADSTKLPEVMHSLKGITKIFQLEKGKLDQTGLRFAVNKVFLATSRAAIMQTTPPEKGLEIQANSHGKEPCSSSSQVATKTRKALFDMQESEETGRKKQKVKGTQPT